MDYAVLFSQSTSTANVDDYKHRAGEPGLRHRQQLEPASEQLGLGLELEHMEQDRDDSEPNTGRTCQWNRVQLDHIDLEEWKFRQIREKVQLAFNIDVKPRQAGAIHDLAIKRHDVIVIAGTGSGKSLVYQSLLAVQTGGIALVISPTLALMHDQIQSLRKTGLTATALTSDKLHKNQSLWTEIDCGKYDIILASPEVLLQDGSHFFKVTLRNKRRAFCRRLRVLAVDEAHLIWGWREFRKEYLNIGTIRSHFPDVPIVALSATLTPNVAEYVVNTLHLRRGQTELYKLSVDRPNIMQFVCQLEYIDDFSVLSRTLIPDRGALWTMPKAMVFVDSIDKGHRIARYLRAYIRNLKRFSKEDAEIAVRPFSANLESSSRETFMQDFITRVSRILVCTDAAGMGVNVRDVDVVMQWGIGTTSESTS